MRWRRCVSPDCGSTDSAGLPARRASDACRVARASCGSFERPCVFKLLNSNIGSLTFHQLRQPRERLVRLARRRRRLPAALAHGSHCPASRSGTMGRLSSSSSVDELADADAATGSQHRLEVVGYARRVRLGFISATRAAACSGSCIGCMQRWHCSVAVPSRRQLRHRGTRAGARSAPAPATLPATPPRSERRPGSSASWIS